MLSVYPWPHGYVLVNNAGYLADARGTNIHVMVNVVAPWSLTKRLKSALQLTAEGKEFGFVRVLNVSGGDAPARIDVDNLEAEKGFRGLMTYTHSKSVLEAMSVVLAQDMKPANVSVNIVFPGRVSTAMTKNLTLGHLPGPITDEAHASFFQVFLPRRRREICEAGGALHSVGLHERCRFRCCDCRSYYRGRYWQAL